MSYHIQDRVSCQLNHFQEFLNYNFHKKQPNTSGNLLHICRLFPILCPNNNIQHSKEII